MKVNYVSIPPPGKNSNPFLGLLCKWLAAEGWQRHEFNFTIPHLIRNRKTVEACYFHWPESIWRSKFLLINFIKGCYFILNCRVALMLGYKLIWSAHNKLPHEYQSYNLEVFLRKFIIRQFHLIVGHAENSYDDLKTIIPFDFKAKYVLAEHGFYENVYKPDNVINRRSLGIPDGKIIILLKASNKSYQGSNTILSYIVSEPIVAGIHFLIFGSEHIQRPAELANTGAVSIFKGKANDRELGALLQISDFVLMPYTSITTSGFYFLSMTFRKPVIAPNIDFFKRNSLPGNVILYDKDNVNEGLRMILENLTTGKRKKNDSDFDKLEIKYNWKLSSQKISEAYLHAINN